MANYSYCKKDFKDEMNDKYENYLNDREVNKIVPPHNETNSNETISNKNISNENTRNKKKPQPAATEYNKEEFLDEIMKIHNDVYFNPYKILEIDREYTPETLKEKYKEMALKYHPDKGGDVEVFQDITKSYIYLLKKYKENMPDKQIFELKDEFNDFSKEMKNNKNTLLGDRNFNLNNFNNAFDQHFTKTTKGYDDFIDYAMRWKLGQVNDVRELKRRFYLMMISINILEGIRFYVSFACTFGFGELRLMEGSAKIISLIARDESQHLAISQHIIKNYKKFENDKEMLSVMAECEEEVYDMYRQAVQEEKDWAKYLFKDGSMIGLSETLLGNYVEYICNKRLRGIGLEPIFDISSRNNPLPWTQHWISSKGLQVAPQETENESYIVGGIKQDVKKDTFADFQL